MSYEQEAIETALTAGWITHVRHIDKDSGKPLLGVRLTNVRQILARALSITIFDRSTVSVSFGFTNDETVKFTNEDGVEFLRYLDKIAPQRPEHGTGYRFMEPYMPAIDWNAIPDQVPEEPALVSTITATTDLAKDRLVSYLVKNHPEQFGRYATGRRAAGEFYDEVRALIEDPGNDFGNVQRTITELCTIVHHSYGAANVHLRIWRKQVAGEALQHWAQAREDVAAAMRIEQHIANLRELHGITAPSYDEFPERIKWDVETLRMIDPPSAAELPPLALFIEGAAVHVIDRDAPEFGKAGVIDHEGNGGYTLQFPHCPPNLYIYTADQLKVIA